MKNYEAAARALAVDLDGTEEFWGEWERLSFRALKAVGVDPQAEVAPRRFQVGDRVRATYVDLDYPNDKVINEFDVVAVTEDTFSGGLPGHTYFHEPSDTWTYELIEEAQ